MNKPASATDLSDMLKRLYLHHTERHLAVLIDRAAKESISNSEFLRLVLDHELSHRHENTVARLIRAARFPDIKTLDGFDWNHPTSIPKGLVLNAFTLEFVRRKEHFIFLGPGGVGKSHLAKALGFAACQNTIRTVFTTAADMINGLIASRCDHGLERALRRYTAPSLLVIDELGCAPRGAETLLGLQCPTAAAAAAARS